MRVFIVAALTTDGFIGRNSEHTADWTGTEDKKIFVKLTKEAGVIVLGSKTFTTIGRALPGRRNIIYTSQPEMITAKGIEPTNEDPAKLLQRLKAEGCQAVAICGGASIYDLFMRRGLVNEIYLTYVPVLFGTGMPLFSSELASKLRHMETSVLPDGSVFSHYTVTP